jgi:hypothetical protein
MAVTGDAAVMTVQKYLDACHAANYDFGRVGYAQ